MLLPVIIRGPHVALLVLCNLPSENVFVPHTHKIASNVIMRCKAESCSIERAVQQLLQPGVFWQPSCLLEFRDVQEARHTVASICKRQGLSRIAIAIAFCQLPQLLHLASPQEPP